MSEHRFTVYVDTDIQIPDNDEHGRQAWQFAESLLWHAGNLDAERTDGWADCTGTASLSLVEYEDSQ